MIAQPMKSENRQINYIPISIRAVEHRAFELGGFKRQQRQLLPDICSQIDYGVDRDRRERAARLLVQRRAAPQIAAPPSSYPVRLKLSTESEQATATTNIGSGDGIQQL
jgi:hypothetical protein